MSSPSPFEFRKITRDDPLMVEVYRLRYKVYCEEWGFEHRDDHPGGLEQDEFDSCSVHLGAFSRENGQLVGTMRLIRASDRGFPIEHHCRITADLSALPKERTGEISRLAISKEFRRRLNDRLIYDLGELSSETLAQIGRDERRKHEFAIVTGLYTCLYQESVALGLTHWYAVMAKGLFILLKRLSITFEQIGPEIEYHGVRTPYIGIIGSIAREVVRSNPGFTDAYTGGEGRLTVPHA